MDAPYPHCIPHRYPAQQLFHTNSVLPPRLHSLLSLRIPDRHEPMAHRSQETPGDRIKRLAAERGLSQDEFAERVATKLGGKTAQPTISRYLNDRRQPRLHVYEVM